MEARTPKPLGRPHKSSTAPLTALRQVLEHERQRGVGFDEAWPLAVQAARAVRVTSAERAPWREAIDETRACWERAYVGAPPTRLEALVADVSGLAGALLVYDSEVELQAEVNEAEAAERRAAA